VPQQEYAGFWIRFGATLIDLVVFSIVMLTPLTLIYGQEYWLGDVSPLSFWNLLFGYVLPAVATIWFWRRYLATPGKMALGLKIVDAQTGGKITLGQSVGRYFAFIVSAMPLFLGYIWVGIDKRKQGFHDKLAGTVVVRRRT